MWHLKLDTCSRISVAVSYSSMLAVTVCCAPRKAPPLTATAVGNGQAATPASSRPLVVATVGASASGKYRNLFAELGKPAAEIDAKVARAYAQLFHGNPNDEAVMFGAGSNDNGPLAYVVDVGNNDIRSEGMSYSMMIALEVDRKDDFNAIWNWAKSYMCHNDPSHPAYGYFSWQMRKDGTAIDEMPAPDGEEYFATALLFAAHRWGNGSGIYDYKSQAFALLDAMKNRKPITGMVNGSRETTGTALFNTEQKMVRFTPDTGNFSKNTDHSDPSYHVPAFYELWALWGPEGDRAFWADAAKTSRDYFVKAANPTTALTPDYAHFDGTPKAASWDPGTANFRWDAFRTAMNWSVDAAWWAKDPRETELSDRLLAFFASQGPKYHCNYTLDGKSLKADESLGLIAMNAVAALAATQPRAWQFVDELYRRSPPKGTWRYYDGMLYAMAMLHLSGKFQIYAPPVVAAAPAAKR